MDTSIVREMPRFVKVGCQEVFTKHSSPEQNRVRDAIVAFLDRRTTDSPLSADEIVRMAMPWPSCCRSPGRRGELCAPAESLFRADPPGVEEMTRLRPVPAMIKMGAG
jgi:hypothetical protein